MRGDRTLSIPISVARRQDLSTDAKFVYGAISAMFDNVGSAGASDARTTFFELHEWTGLDPISLKLALGELRLLHLVEVEAWPPPAALDVPIDVYPVATGSKLDEPRGSLTYEGGTA